jgi:hypothetical protein
VNASGPVSSTVVGEPGADGSSSELVMTLAKPLAWSAQLVLKRRLVPCAYASRPDDSVSRM